MVPRRQQGWNSKLDVTHFFFFYSSIIELVIGNSSGKKQSQLNVHLLNWCCVCQSNCSHNNCLSTLVLVGWPNSICNPPQLSDPSDSFGYFLKPTIQNIMPTSHGDWPGVCFHFSHNYVLHVSGVQAFATHWMPFRKVCPIIPIYMSVASRPSLFWQAFSSTLVWPFWAAINTFAWMCLDYMSHKPVSKLEFLGI